MIRFIVIIFVIWRLLLFFIAWLGEKILPFSPRFPYSDLYLIPSDLPSWLWSFANSDGVHYLTIAKSGYSAQFTQVFFPLYPIFINIIHRIIPFISPISIGLIVSGFFFFFSLIVFGKLLRLDYKWQDIHWILLFLIFSPTSFFFGSLYTESLFLFLVLSSFYFARKKRWWLAGISGGLASGTRLVGIFLLPALLWEWHKDKCKMQNAKCKITIKNLKLSELHRYIFHFSFFIFHSPVTYLVPLGLLIYMIYLQINFGDMLYFWHVQPVFGAERSGGSIIILPQVIYRYMKMLITLNPSLENYWIVLSELVFTLISIVLLLIAHGRKVRLSYLIFSWLAVLIPSLTGTFSSMPRYVLVAFPLFIIMGLIRNWITKIILLFVFCFLLFIYTFLFTRGHWVS